MTSELCPCGAPRQYRKPRHHNAPNNNGWRGLCYRCYRRWADHGYPDSGVPDPAPHVGGWEGGHEGYLARFEDYLFLRKQGLPQAAAAVRLGLTRRTLQRYENALKSAPASLQDQDQSTPREDMAS